MSVVAAHHAVVTRARTWPATLPPFARPAARSELIERSHQRCAALGLSRVQPPDFEALVCSSLSLASERNRRLLAHAAPVMEMLFEQIIGTDSMIVLSDAQGTILHALGDDGFLDRARKIARVPGANWAEQSKGTNAIGTALFEEAPTLVHGDEHFMHANSFLTSSATPIFDPRGSMLGVLDVSGDQRLYHRHTMGLVRMSARMIENHWLSDEYGSRLRLHFHSRAEFIGTLQEGVLVVAADGKLLGANRSALDQLRMSSMALRMRSLASLFGTTAEAVFDHFCVPQPAPMCLALPDGRQFHASARFNGAARPLMAGVEIDAPTAPSVATTAAATDVAAHSEASRSPGSPGPAGQSATLAGLQHLQTGDTQVEALVHKVQRVLNRGIPLLILGETGTGKELLARAVHQDSSRARQAFVAVNCASIPETLIEAELFGYEDGAFTGARRKGAPGRIAQANGGTLFLDEIGDMPLPLQARLLRVLQERSVTPLGSQKSIAVDIAVICATHCKLRDMIDAGAFREDLYYRLNGLVVRLPALRERSDLEVVAQRVLRAVCPQGAPQISPAVMALFKRYAWPGNIRQLANVLRTAAVMAAGEPQITEQHLPDDFLEDVQRMPAAVVVADPPLVLAEDTSCELAATLPLNSTAEPAVTPAPAEAEAAPAGEPPRTLAEAEIHTIRQALAAAAGNISEASKRLGISRNTIYRKLYWGKAS